MKKRWLLIVVLTCLAWQPVAAADIVSYAIVQPDATLKMRGKIIRLFGVHVPSSGRVCQRNLRPARVKQRAGNAQAYTGEDEAVCEGTPYEHTHFRESGQGLHEPDDLHLRALNSNTTATKTGKKGG